jgi:hypothetical protein
MRNYFYLTPEGAPIRIKAKRKPSKHTLSGAGTWIVNEYNSLRDTWTLPAYPEITLGTLNKMQYIGSVKARGCK